MIKERLSSFHNKNNDYARFDYCIDGKYYNRFGFDRFGNNQNGRHITNRSYCERTISRNVVDGSLALIQKETDLINSVIFIIKILIKLFLVNIFILGILSMINIIYNINDTIVGLTYMNILLLSITIIFLIFKMLFCSAFLYRMLHIVFCDFTNKETKMFKLFYEFDLIRVLIKYEIVKLSKESYYNYKLYYGLLSKIL